MTSHQSNAFLLSTILHVTVVVVLLFFTYSIHQKTKEPDKIFELVAGAGDNFGATVAPALGGSRSGGAPSRTIAQQLRRSIVVADSRARQQVAKERAEEEKRLAQQQREEQARAKSAETRSTEPNSSKLTKIDAEGIAQGVIGGSTANKVGGAGGKALTATEGTLMERYFAMLKQRLLEAWERPPGSSDALSAEVEFRVAADGRISGVRLIRRSGSAEFDRAVLAAFSRIEMPKRPDGRSDVYTLELRATDAQGR